MQDRTKHIDQSVNIGVCLFGFNTSSLSLIGHLKIWILTWNHVGCR